MNFVTCRGDLICIISQAGAYGSEYGLISLFDVRSCAQLQTMQHRHRISGWNDFGDAKALAWSPDSKKLAFHQMCGGQYLVLGCLTRQFCSETKVRKI